MVSPHLSAPSFPGARGPDGAQAPRQGALALGPGYGAGAWVVRDKHHGFWGKFMVLKSWNNGTCLFSLIFS